MKVISGYISCDLIYLYSLYKYGNFEPYLTHFFQYRYMSSYRYSLKTPNE